MGARTGIERRGSVASWEESSRNSKVREGGSKDKKSWVERLNGMFLGLNISCRKLECRAALIVSNTKF